MKTTIINLYSFTELNNEAKQTAIEEQRFFILSNMQISDFISGDSEYDTEENLQKSLDAESEHILMNDAPVIESIVINDYLFFANGEMANCTTYTGLYPKTGITELKFCNEVYTVK